MSLALSICALFISLMQSVSLAHFLNITSLSFLRSTAATAATNIVPLTSIYTFDLSIEVLNSI